MSPFVKTTLEMLDSLEMGDKERAELAAGVIRSLSTVEAKRRLLQWLAQQILSPRIEEPPS